MIRITQLKLPINHTKEQLEKKIARTLKCQEGSFTYEIIRQSLDARHRDDKKFAYTVDVMVPKEKQILKKEWRMADLCGAVSSICKSDFYFGEDWN